MLLDVKLVLERFGTINRRSLYISLYISPGIAGVD